MKNFLKKVENLQKIVNFKYRKFVNYQKKSVDKILAEIEKPVNRNREAVHGKIGKQFNNFNI